MIKQALFRTDASYKIGTGHLLRSLALAQYLKSKSINVKFLTVPFLPKLIGILKKNNIEVELLQLKEDCLGTEKDLNAIYKNLGQTTNWVILDNYYFKYDFQYNLRKKGVKVLTIDDCAQGRFCSDIILNHGISAKNFNYNSESHTKLLLGTEYALLRKDIRADAAYRSRKLLNPRIKNILVSLGGLSHKDILVKIIQGLNQCSFIKNMQVKILTGIGKDNTPGINAFINKSANFSVENFNINMKKTLRWADMAICAAGGTLWELCFYGISGIVGILAENQAINARLLDKSGVFKSIGWYKDATQEAFTYEMKRLLDKDIIYKMKKNASNLVDGNGCQRILTVMQNI